MKDSQDENREQEQEQALEEQGRREDERLQDEPEETNSSDQAEEMDAQARAALLGLTSGAAGGSGSGNESASVQAPTKSKAAAVWMGISFALLIVLIVYIGFGPGQGSASNGEAVAKVNDVEISKEQLYQVLVEAGGEASLENLITEELIRQEAVKQNIVVSDEDIAEEWDRVKSGFTSDEEFTGALAQAGYTEDSLRKQIAVQVRLNKLLESKSTITDEDVKQFYEENKASFMTPERMRASHILLETQEEAEAVLEELKQGADFAELAMQNSIDPGSKDYGGDLDYFGRGEMVPEFEEAAFALQVDEMSGIVQTVNGYHIILATDHIAESTATYEEKEEELRDYLVDQELYELTAPWLEELRGAAAIENYLTPAAAAE